MKVLSRDEFEQANIFGTGLANEAFARYFIGESFLNPLTDPKECPLFLANVTFEPGCRNNWHIHHATDGGGQLLSVPQARAGIKRKGKRQSALCRGWLLQFPQM